MEINHEEAHILNEQQVLTVLLYGVPIVSLRVEGIPRLCLSQICSSLLQGFSYNEIHNRRVALGITCMQCSPGQLELLRRFGAMPVSSRRCGMITKREAERLVSSFMTEIIPPRLPMNLTFRVRHSCGWGCKGLFIPARYNSSRAKCIECCTCRCFFSPNKFVFHFHQKEGGPYKHPDAANFNSWRRHLFLCEEDQASEVLVHAWEDLKAMFNGGSRRKVTALSIRMEGSNSESKPAMPNSDRGILLGPSHDGPGKVMQADVWSSWNPFRNVTSHGNINPEKQTVLSYGNFLRTLSQPYSSHWQPVFEPRAFGSSQRPMHTQYGHFSGIPDISRPGIHRAIGGPLKSNNHMDVASEVNSKTKENGTSPESGLENSMDTGDEMSEDEDIDVLDDANDSSSPGHQEQKKISDETETGYSLNGNPNQGERNIEMLLTKLCNKNVSDDELMTLDTDVIQALIGANRQMMEELANEEASLKASINIQTVKSATLRQQLTLEYNDVKEKFMTLIDAEKNCNKSLEEQITDAKHLIQSTPSVH